ncbi:octapeptide-repeat protein T2-like [Pleurodeles waltl]|uniref:octapeptide-repeat protein T2-like n=1 Tax=Pleurodeles waltl TaxID=8319 RepID=UPI0037096EBE
MKKEAGRERGEEEERGRGRAGHPARGLQKRAESEGKKDSRGAERGWRRERKAEDRGTGEERSFVCLCVCTHRKLQFRFTRSTTFGMLGSCCTSLKSMSQSLIVTQGG